MLRFGPSPANRTRSLRSARQAAAPAPTTLANCPDSRATGSRAARFPVSPLAACVRRATRSSSQASGEVLSKAIGGKYSRNGAKADPLSRMRRTAGEIESAQVRTPMCQPSFAHEFRRHHGIHAVARQGIFRAPFRGGAPRKHSILADSLLPPFFFQQFLQVLGLSLRSDALRFRVVHGPKKPRRRPSIARFLRIQNHRPNQKPAALVSTWQQKSQVRRLLFSSHREISAHSRRLQWQLFAARTAGTLPLIEQLEVSADSTVRNNRVRRNFFSPE